MPPSKEKAWTAPSDVLLRCSYPTSTFPTLFKLFPNRTKMALQTRAKKLGIARLRTDSIVAERLNLTETQYAYFAGLIDADGSINFCRATDKRIRRPFYYRLYLQVSNTDERMISWCKNTICAGSIRCQRKLNRLPIYTWACSTSIALALLGHIVPYLTAKREQAEALLGGYRHLSEAERESLYTRLRGYKTKGKQRNAPLIA